MSPAERKQKRTRSWGIVLLSFAGLEIIEGIVLAIVMHDPTLVFALGGTGAVLGVIGFLLMKKSKKE